MNCELIVDARNGTGESPVWHASEQALYWVDIPARQLHRWQATDGKHQVWQGDEMLACIARSGQGWVAGMESGISSPGQATAALIAACSAPCRTPRPACVSTMAAAIARAASGPAPCCWTCSKVPRGCAVPP